MRVFYFLNLCVLGLSLQACATRLDDADDRIADLQKRMALVEQKSGMPIGSDRELLDGQRLADTRTQIAAIQNEVTVLSGKVESVEYETKNLTAMVRELQGKWEAKEREAKRAAQESASPSFEEELSAAEVEYNKALKAYQDGEFDSAEKLFSAFVQKYPKHDLADNSLFWIGDGYMSQKMYKNAVGKFQALIERYPKSDMRCEALRNQITCLKALSMDKEAAAFAKVRAAECPNQ